MLASEAEKDVLLQQLEVLIQEQKEVELRRIQYPREYKLRAISYWRSQQGLEALLSKYAIAKRLRISEKMRNDWISQEEAILSMRKGQQKDSKGQTATLLEIEDYLHMEFLQPWQDGVQIS